MNDTPTGNDILDELNHPTADQAPQHEDRTEFESDTIVGECGVTLCRFNVSRQCRAGSVSIAFVNGMAHCATYDPKDPSYDKFSVNTAESV